MASGSSSGDHGSWILRGILAFVVLCIIATQPLAGSGPLWKTALRVVLRPFGLAGPGAPAKEGRQRNAVDISSEPVESEVRVDSGNAGEGLKVATREGTRNARVGLSSGSAERGAIDAGSREGPERPGRRGEQKNQRKSGGEKPARRRRGSQDNQEKATPTVARTATPIPTEGATPTPTELARLLSAGRVDAEAGEPFEIAVSCDDAGGIAGGDIALTYNEQLIRVTAVRKTDVTGNMMVVKRITEGALTVSMAGVESLPEGPGALVAIEGVVSASAPANSLAEIRFVRNRLYDVESKRIPVETQNGLVRIHFRESDGGASDPVSGPGETPGVFVFPTRGPEGTPATEPPEPTVPVRATPSSDPDSDVWEDEDGDVLLEVDVTPTLPVSSATETPTPTWVPTPELLTDLDQNGVVDTRDLFLFMGQWKLETAGGAVGE